MHSHPGFNPDVEICEHIYNPPYQVSSENLFVLYKVYKSLQFSKPLVFSAPSLFPLLWGLAVALHPAAKRLVGYWVCSYIKKKIHLISKLIIGTLIFVNQ